MISGSCVVLAALIRIFDEIIFYEVQFPRFWLAPRPGLGILPPARPINRKPKNLDRAVKFALKNHTVLVFNSRNRARTHVRLEISRQRINTNPIRQSRNSQLHIPVLITTNTNTFVHYKILIFK